MIAQHMHRQKNMYLANKVIAVIYKDFVKIKIKLMLKYRKKIQILESSVPRVKKVNISQDAF